MATRKKPPQPWGIKDLRHIGVKGARATYMKAVPVLILEAWVRGGRKEEKANLVETNSLAGRLKDSGLKSDFREKGASNVVGALSQIQIARNLTLPPLIAHKKRGVSWINLPHYEQLLQEYRLEYRGRFPEDYGKLFPAGEPDWGYQARPTSAGTEVLDETRSLFEPLEKALRERDQTIARLKEENQRLQAELVASEVPERRITDGKLLFVHTSPNFHRSVYGRKVTSIKDTVTNMLGRAERSVRISTLQMDIFTSELITLKQCDPELEITVLTRAQPQGDRRGIAMRSISLMRDAGIQVYTDQELLHSRMVVIDNKEALVSSADLDTTMMDLEFNAGIWTTNSDVVDEAIRYFDNILSLHVRK